METATEDETFACCFCGDPVTRADASVLVTDGDGTPIGRAHPGCGFDEDGPLAGIEAEGGDGEPEFDEPDDDTHDPESPGDWPDRSGRAHLACDCDEEEGEGMPIGYVPAADWGGDWPDPYDDPTFTLPDAPQDAPDKSLKNRGEARTPDPEESDLFGKTPVLGHYSDDSNTRYNSGRPVGRGKATA